MLIRKPLVLIIGSLLFLAACSEESGNTAPREQQIAEGQSAEYSAAVQKAHEQAGVQAKVQALAQGRAGKYPYQGRVLSATEAGSYTYLEVETETEGKKVWIATSKTTVETGDLVGWADAALMRDFESKSLGTVFPEILFVGAVHRVGGSVAPSSAPAASGGEVISLLEGGGYVYLEVRTSGGDKWLAAPVAPAQVGDKVSWAGGSVMRNFASSSLGRSFDEILFIGEFSVAN